MCWVSSLKLFIKSTNPSRSIPVPAWLINTSVPVSSCLFEGIILICTNSSDLDNEGSGGCPMCSECVCSWAAPSLLLGLPEDSSAASQLLDSWGASWPRAGIGEKPNAEDNKFVPWPEETPDCVSLEENPIIQWMNFPILSQNFSCRMLFQLCWMAVGI